MKVKRFSFFLRIKGRGRWMAREDERKPGNSRELNLDYRMPVICITRTSPCREHKLRISVPILTLRYDKQAGLYSPKLILENKSWDYFKDSLASLGYFITIFRFRLLFHLRFYTPLHISIFTTLPEPNHATFSQYNGKMSIPIRILHDACSHRI